MECGVSAPGIQDGSNLLAEIRERHIELRNDLQPTENHILLGRGLSHNSNPANVWFMREWNFLGHSATLHEQPVSSCCLCAGDDCNFVSQLLLVLFRLFCVLVNILYSYLSHSPCQE